MKFFIVLFAVVAAVSAGYISHHEPEVHHVLTIPQHTPIPPPHPKPLTVKGYDHVNKIHYDSPHVPHPHLVGVEHYVPAPEPGISVVKTEHGWH
ncbi:hypothetical protein CAJAP_04215 [Camponotus japonicus]